MKRIFLTTIALLSLPLISLAQGTVNELTTDMGARLGADADVKLSRGLHLGVGAEVRTKDNFKEIGRAQASAGVSYKLNSLLGWDKSKELKVGAGYYFIERKNSSDEWKSRHRVYTDASFGIDAGMWRLSLRERLQLTHRNVSNTYQSTPNSLALKSRLKASYRGLGDWRPYAAAEARVVLNDPACSAVWNGSTYSEYTLTGYTDSYLNRIRAVLGTEWKIDKDHSLDFFLLADYTYDKNIDTNKAGNQLKSLTYDQGLSVQLGVSYSFDL